MYFTKIFTFLVSIQLILSVDLIRINSQYYQPCYDHINYLDYSCNTQIIKVNLFKIYVLAFHIV